MLLCMAIQTAYFSAYPILKDEILKGNMDWSKDNIIAYYDAVCEEVNKTFHVL